MSKDVAFVERIALVTGGSGGIGAALCRRLANEGATDYAASKAGLHGITHFLAGRVVADGVTVNALAPGLIDTPMLPPNQDALVESVPVKRFGTPDEVADLAVAILRNAYVKSKVFSLDGGAFPR